MQILLSAHIHVHVHVRMDLWGDLSSHYDWMVSMVMLKNVTCCGGVFDTLSHDPAS